MSELDQIAELNHLINSPLAAIRNALYLASTRTDDPDLLRYLQICNDEVTSIADSLRSALREATAENGQRRGRVLQMRRAAA